MHILQMGIANPQSSNLILNKLNFRDIFILIFLTNVKFLEICQANNQ